MRSLMLGFMLLLPLAGADFTKRLTPDEVEKLMKDGNVFLLDVREPKEIAEGGALKGYVNIPMSQLESRLKEIPKDKLIVTICARAMRATNAAEILTRNGYHNVAGACSMNDWKESKKPLGQQVSP